MTGPVTIFIDGPMESATFLQMVKDLPERSEIFWKDNPTKIHGREWFRESEKLLRQYLETSRYKLHHITIIVDGKTVFQSADLPTK